MCLLSLLINHELCWKQSQKTSFFFGHHNNSPLTCIALIIPTCAHPLAPPPPNTSPTDLPDNQRANLEKSECTFGSDIHTFEYNSFCKQKHHQHLPTEHRTLSIQFYTTISWRTSVSNTIYDGAMKPTTSYSTRQLYCVVVHHLLCAKAPIPFAFALPDVLSPFQPVIYVYNYLRQVFVCLFVESVLFLNWVDFHLNQQSVYNPPVWYSVASMPLRLNHIGTVRFCDGLLAGPTKTLVCTRCLSPLLSRLKFYVLCQKSVLKLFLKREAGRLMAGKTFQ